ncbi:hypothetical protein Cni_G20190 [Canna indica]|uniref:Uncharacterized protein n=1 Tax=Canna indica TaxID=4628 RepID=A0AAQ3QJ98_9LILI|nr:hypothetical protein Cni_G20190 [Canna indica]
MDACTEASPRRSSAASSSPEFEFWAVSDPPPQLLTADELFADGVLLPLHLLSLRPQPHPEPDPEAPPGTKPEPAPDPSPRPPPPPQLPAADLATSISCSPTSGSKRWKDIFRVGEKKTAEEKERRRERKGGGGGIGGAPELNINIWPFSRSRSAGSAAAGGARPRTSLSGRRVSSAPCSRSNSRGESSKQAVASGGRRWAASPGRPVGVPVGRASPVWQIRRPEHRERDKVTAGRKSKVLNMNVNTCIGYGGGGQRSCRGDDKHGVTGRERTAGDSGGSLFSLRALFSKKVY